MTTPYRIALDLQRERTGQSLSRYHDVGIEWWCGDELILCAGGRWDNSLHEWSGDNQETVRYELHPGQAQAARDFARWLEMHLSYRQRLSEGYTPAEARADVCGDGAKMVYLWHWFGPRRGGKTHLATLAMIVYAVVVPGARIVALSPTQKKDIELRNALYKLVPAAWRSLRGTNLDMITGSVIELHTGGAATELKLGEVSFAVANEAQSIRESSIVDMRGNLADKGGAVILAYNPPRTTKGKWLTDLYKQWLEGNDPHALAHFFDRRLNPHTDNEPLEAIKMSDRQKRIDLYGDMSTPLTDVIFPLFSIHTHVRLLVPPEWTDVTEELARLRCGHRVPWIGGLDFDQGAGCSWSLLRVYRDEYGQDVVLIHDGVREKDYSEDQLDDRLRAACARMSVRPDDIVWVPDASGEFQSTTNRAGRDKGPSSWKILRRKGWRRLCYPQAESKRNPSPSIKRYNTARELMRQGRIHVLSTATEVIESLRLAPTKRESEERNRNSPYVHLCDGVTYPIYRLFHKGDRKAAKGARLTVSHIPRPESSTDGYRG